MIGHVQDGFQATISRTTFLLGVKGFLSNGSFAIDCDLHLGINQSDLWDIQILGFQSVEFLWTAKGKSRVYVAEKNHYRNTVLCVILVRNAFACLESIT